MHGFGQLDEDATFLLYSNAPAPPGIPSDPRFQWIHLPSRNGRWWSLVDFPLAARKAGAQAIHTQYSLSPLVGPRGVTTIHDVSFFVGPEWFRPRDRFLLQRSVPAAARRARRVITVSDTSKAEIERHIPASTGKVRVTPNACPPWVERVETDRARQAVASLGVTSPFLLTVGTRWPRKNFELARAAVDLLPPEVPHRLVVTGKAGWGDEADSARVQRVGYVDAAVLNALYSCASLYLAPSRHEGFGIPLLEAWKCGCPVLCSQGGALPEVAGDAAEVEPTWDPKHWAETIFRLLHDSSKLEALRQRGLTRVERTSWRETAALTLAVYQEVAE